MSRPGFENVFVLNTGRCGSTTLARACAHLTSHGAGHETRTHLTGPDRLAYPSPHIEADNRLSWFLGRLDETWGDRAAYVHLTRDPEAVARSFVARPNPGILRAYRTGILLGAGWKAPAPDPLVLARDYVDTVTANIRHFLRDKSRVMELRLETLEDDLPRFLDWIGATGDLAAARAEIAHRHNATPEA
ncbi:hypothetical protein OG2516_04728 [Oceanicola granulosus HTCC2516]|uniref:Sulfotransferase family protein n=1 Tax=Oceanicola granulosus (strain ATCC BAA-861 / DSM 15982 / KCTC 12143 / HTCC2516) TaxID=314256 RepID=Q2CAR5_OCEGH|nr:hypothetical protein [Oceanicola granulosus]EAR49773.1 hypothetical protein OG2516_04728 [Oceanicola granulosus HTCC2516]